MPEKKQNLRYNENEMCWQDSEGNTIPHPRYSERPASLEGRGFMKSYLQAVRKGESLNTWMKTNQKFSAKDVQSAARKMRKAYQAMAAANGTGDTFPLLKKVIVADPHELGKDVASILVELGMKAPGHPAITGSKKA